MRGWTMALGVAVAAALAGVIARGTATASTPIHGVPVQVTVWRDLDNGDVYVGAREWGRLWRREPAALAFSVTSASGRFQRSGIVELAIPLRGLREASLKAVVWRSVADPSRLYLSVQREGWGWRTVSAPLTMRAYGERYERADAVGVAAPLDRLRLTSVAGPLAVFTADADETWTDADGWRRTREVYVLDTATDRYWRAFAYRHDRRTGGVLTAGERLIVWDGRQVRRVGLKGWGEVLYEGEGISEVKVSPDGEKVAVMAGDGALTVLDAATGETLLRVDGRAALTALLPETTGATFSLEGWNAASDRLAIAANAPTGESRTGILALDGSLHMLPPNAGNLSPDFRYAIQPHGEGCLYGWITWGAFDVIETESERSVRTVTAPENRFFALRDDSHVPVWRGWWPAPNRYAWYETRYGCHEAPAERASEEGAVAASTVFIPILDVPVSSIPLWEEDASDAGVDGTPALLDVASGEAERLTRAEWDRLRLDAERLHARGCTGHSAQACSLAYEGRPVWKNGPVEAVGVIDLAEPLDLNRVALLASPQPSPAPHRPHPRPPEMEGPLLAWSEDAGYEVTVDADDGSERFLPIRRVVVYDEGTGRSWRAFDYRYRDEEPAVWPAQGGFVVRAGGTVRHVTPDGQSRLLLDEDWDSLDVHVSPSGAKAVVAFRQRGTFFNVTLAVLALSGGELLRTESADPRFDGILKEHRDWWDENTFLHAFSPPELVLSWSADETALSAGFLYTGASLARDAIWWGAFTINGESTPPAEAPVPEAERASVDCSSHADHRCAVLLDGEVVGEGRWAEPIGFVALD